MTPVAYLLPGWGTPPERLRPLRTALDDVGVESRVWRYAPSGTLSTIVDALTSAARDEDRPLHLVGHSLGGIVVAAATLAAPDAVRTVTTVNAPWRGTWLGYTGSTELARQLRWGSSDLRELRRDLARHLRHETGPRWRVIAMYGDLGTPPSTAAATPTGPRLSRTLLPLWGHSVSLLTPRLTDDVVRHIVADGPTTDARRVAADADGERAEAAG